MHPQTSKTIKQMVDQVLQCKVLSKTMVLRDSAKGYMAKALQRWTPWTRCAWRSGSCVPAVRPFGGCATSERDDQRRFGESLVRSHGFP